VGERRDAYRDLMGKPEETRSLLTYRSRWENDISMDFKDEGWKGSWTGFVRVRIQTRFVPKLSYSKFYTICTMYY
jgi:hypothetical protein